MKFPFPLYVDEISPDKIKATVSNSNKIIYNLRMILKVHSPFFAHSYPGTLYHILGEEVNGIRIAPVGKFICMMVRNGESQGMIFLNLINNLYLAEEMAEKLNLVKLQGKFMQVYIEIVHHPENQNKFKLFLGHAESN